MLRRSIVLLVFTLVSGSAVLSDYFTTYAIIGEDRCLILQYLLFLQQDQDDLLLEESNPLLS